MNYRVDYLKKVKRIVVKVGTSTLAHKSGLLNLNNMDILVRQLSNIHNSGKEVILVTSGAVGAGMGKLGFKSRPKTIEGKQAAAAVGQGILMHMYEKLFSEYGKTIAQILLTKDDMTNETRYNNAKNTFNALLEHGVIPIVNENDAIIVDELELGFGENDTLSALVTVLSDADLLILLSDIEGLYTNDPHKDKTAKLISRVDKIDDSIEGLAGGSSTTLGTGGMITKINAAKIVTAKNSSMVIVDGSCHGIIDEVLEGKEVGTWFI